MKPWQAAVLKLLAVSIGLSVMFFIINEFLPAWVFSGIHALNLVYFLLTLLTLALNLWAIKRGFLVTLFIASQVIRIILSLVIIYFFMSSAPSEANVLVVNFFVLYLCYLIFEIITLLSNLRTEFRRP